MTSGAPTGAWDARNDMVCWGNHPEVFLGANVPDQGEATSELNLLVEREAIASPARHTIRPASAPRISRHLRSGERLSWRSSTFFQFPAGRGGRSGAGEKKVLDSFNIIFSIRRPHLFLAFFLLAQMHRRAMRRVALGGRAGMERSKAHLQVCLRA